MSNKSKPTSSSSSSVTGFSNTKPKNIEYLEQYLNQLSTLPSELNRFFGIITTTDGRVKHKLEQIDRKTADYLTREQLPITSEDACKFRDEMSKLFHSARTLTEDKIDFANQSYEAVDKYIRRLDDDLEMFEIDLKAKAKEEGIDLDKLIQDDHKKAELVGLSAVASIFPHLIKSGNDPALEDMPIDPNEPTYCFCKQVSYGQMIGCDNMECAIEWFHFGCVSLMQKPKGKWYCPMCAPNFPKVPDKTVQANQSSSSNKRRSGRN